jgi:hypothetical protein
MINLEEVFKESISQNEIFKKNLKNFQEIINENGFTEENEIVENFKEIEKIYLEKTKNTIPLKIKLHFEKKSNFEKNDIINEEEWNQKKKEIIQKISSSINKIVDKSNFKGNVDDFKIVRSKSGFFLFIFC